MVDLPRRVVANEHYTKLVPAVLLLLPWRDFNPVVIVLYVQHIHLQSVAVVPYVPIISHSTITRGLAHQHKTIVICKDLS